MEAYIIEGPDNVGKSTLIEAQYKRLMNSNKYELLESENLGDLSDFRIIIQNKDTKECIYLNSPTDDKGCINLFKDFYNKHSATYKITKIVTSCKNENYPHLRALVYQFIEKTIKVTSLVKIDISSLKNI